MSLPAKSINPEEYILSVLTPEERLDAAFSVAKAAFTKTKLSMSDIENAVSKVRSRFYEKKK